MASESSSSLRIVLNRDGQDTVLPVDLSRPEFTQDRLVHLLTKFKARYVYFTSVAVCAACWPGLCLRTHGSFALVQAWLYVLVYARAALHARLAPI